jgi:L-iditol 2-dehydrogenase
MRVARLHAVGVFQIHDEPVPTPHQDETLVRVTAVGVCGSDLHWFSEGGIGDARLDHPLILGHEFAGVTPDGQRVAVDPAIACGKCMYCLEGSPNLCENMHFAGHGSDDGALREFVAWPTRFLYPLPSSMSDADGAMLEPLGVALYAIDLAGLRPGMRVGIFGCGPIGLLVVQLARISGAIQIIATDKLPHRVDIARMMGASHAIQADAGHEISEVLTASQNRGLDVAFEVAGENEAVETAIAAARPGGRVILAGIPADDRTSFVASVARRKGLTLQLVRRMKHTYPRAIHLVEQGLIDVRSVVSHHFPFEKAVDAYTVAARREGLKIIIDLR